MANTTTKTKKKTQATNEQPTMEDLQAQMQEMQKELAREKQEKEDLQAKLAAKGTGGRKADFANSVTSYVEKINQLEQGKIKVADNRQLQTCLWLTQAPDRDLESIAKQLDQKKSSPSTARSWGKQWIACLDYLGILNHDKAKEYGLVE